MLMLAVDRSSPRAGVALYRDGACLALHEGHGDTARAPEWMADLRDRMVRAGVEIRTLDLLAVGLGPGSFSGIRAAVAALQGMGLPFGIPLVGVSSAAALAWQELRLRERGGRVSVVGDARRERIWAATFTCGRDGALLCIDPQGITRRPLHTEDDFALVPRQRLPDAIPAPALILSPDWDRLGATLSSQFPPDRLICEVRRPAAEDVARLVMDDPASARREPSPVYLHPPVAARSEG